MVVVKGSSAPSSIHTDVQAAQSVVFEVSRLIQISHFIKSTLLLHKRCVLCLLLSYNLLLNYFLIFICQSYLLVDYSYNKYQGQRNNRGRGYCTNSGCRSGYNYYGNNGKYNYGNRSYKYDCHSYAGCCLPREYYILFISGFAWHFANQKSF